MIENKIQTFQPQVLSLATQFEDLCLRYDSLKAIVFDKDRTVYWEQFTNREETIDWREVTPRMVFALRRARNERYMTLTDLGQQPLADALAEKYLPEGQNLLDKRR